MPCSIPMNVILFGKRFFAGDQVKMKSLGWALIQYDCVLIKRGNVDTQSVTHTGKTLCEHEGSEWHYVSTSQGPPKITRKPGERLGTDVPSQS